MKKILLSVLSVALCLCLIVPIGVTAFAKNEEAPIVAESSVTLEEYLADAAAKGNRVQVVNSNANDTLDKIGDAFGSLASTSPKTVFMKLLAKVINLLSNTLINVIGKALGFVIPKTSVIHDYADFDLDSYGNFYKGMSYFLDAPAAGAKWHLPCCHKKYVL